MARRKIRDEDEAQQFLEAAACSGLERAAWARQHGIDGRSLNAWRLVFARREAKKLRTGLRLLEVVQATATSSRSASPFHVRFDDLELEVPSDFDSAALRRLMDALRAC